MAEPVGIVTGLSVELRIAHRALGDLDHAACAAAVSQQAAKEAESLIAAGACALLSFGVAGGLDPRLGPGKVILADSLITLGGRRLPSDPTWHAAVQAVAKEADPAVVSGPLLGSDRAIVEPARKQKLHRDTGALGVDMESHAVAGVAAAHGLPFLALRALADPADRALPRCVLGIIGKNGRPRTAALIRGLCLRPWEMAALPQLKRDFRTALGALEKAGRALKEPLLGRP